MKNLLILVLIFISLQVKADNYQLVGKRQYIYNEKGLRTQKISFDSEGRTEKKVLYFYDSKGNKIRTEKYLGNDTLLAVYNYRFNDKNEKINSFKTDWAKNKKSSKLYFYNDKEQNFKSEYYTGANLIKKVEYEFDKFGNQTKYATYNAKGEQTSLFYTENKYDNKGRLRKKYKRNNKGVLEKEYQYNYNNKSQVTSSITIYHDGKRANSKRVYTFDSKGRKTGFDKFVSAIAKK